MRKAKRWVKVLVGILLAVVLLVGAYVAYVFLDYHRIGDQELAAQGRAERPLLIPPHPIPSCLTISASARTRTTTAFLWDGGTESWAWSEERLTENLNHIADFLKGQADFCLVQEVDIDSTRSYHVDEREPLCDAREGDSYVFAQNYDSPFLMYPLTQPHGASRSGLLTFSPVTITSANRVELPVETGVMKLLDLDRCYSVSRIPTNGSKELILYNLHLSAYTSDGTIATQQLKLLLADMQAEYEAGNWCVAGGDFNKDLLGDSAYYFGEADQAYSWAQPIPEGTFDNYDISLVAPLDESAPVPSCRNADSAYHEGQYVLTVDGFLVSKNVTVENAAVVDTGFQWSDHNPVIMTFTLLC